MATRKAAPVKAAATKRPAAKRASGTTRTPRHANRPSHIHSIAEGESYPNMMLYGPPGAGKSHLTGTRPRTLILANNADETVSVRNTGVAGIDRWVVNDITDLTEAYEYLRHGGTNDYDWCWLDNASLFQDQNMDYLMDNVVAAKSNRNRYQPDRPEYGQNQNMIGAFVRQMVALPIAFGMTAHVMQKTDPLTDEDMYMPLLQGGQGEFSQKVCGWMNIVGYLDTRQSKKGDRQFRVLYTQKSGKIYAKDRFGKLGGRLVDPTIPKIEDLISGKLTRKKA